MRALTRNIDVVEVIEMMSMMSMDMEGDDLGSI